MKSKDLKDSKRTAASVASRGDDDRDDVAVVGIGCRFPQAASPEAFWDNLLAGRNAITSVPDGRWSDARSAAAFRGGFIDHADCFDAGFFRISPKEAEFMDPQQRVLLEVLWHTLEDARVRPSSLAGRKVGVFMGVCNNDYVDLLAEFGVGDSSGLYGSTGTSSAILSNRVSFVFDFRGPSVTVDTACSSSLVAVLMAARAIRSGECEAALAGGVNICWAASRFLAFAQAGMLSKDGVCRTFDAHANGYVRGEGAGAVLLKPLRRALADGNEVYGVIRGGAINHGGRTRGLTVTNPDQQRQLLIDAYRDAGVDPAMVGYIEVHGTGTSLGDPIELLGLKQAFESTHLAAPAGRARSRTRVEPGQCVLGAVKTNIGHLEGAAGIAGLIKVLLALRHHTIPANLNFQTLNPRIKLEGTRFRIPTETLAWPAPTSGRSRLRRRAGVSSFGYGGAYAHVVVEEFRRTGAASRRKPVEAGEGPGWWCCRPATRRACATGARRWRNICARSGRRAVRRSPISSIGSMWPRRSSTSGSRSSSMVSMRCWRGSTPWWPARRTRPPRCRRFAAARGASAPRVPTRRRSPR